MKKPILLFAILTLISLGGGIVKSATINWTNTVGGDWNDTNNWDLHQVPGLADTAVLSINLAGSLTVPTNNVLNWTGGSVTSGLLLVSSNATINWSGGDLSGGSLMVATGALLTISNSVSFGFNAGNYSLVPNGGFLTNNGTVVWAANINGYGASVIQNAGLWQSVADNAVTTQSGTNIFINASALQKSGGTGQSSIAWNVISTGTIDTPSGSLALNFSGVSAFHGTANLSGGSIKGALTLASNSVVNWSSGTIGGAVNISANAVMSWSGGDMSGGSLTVAPGGNLNASNTVSFGFNAGNYVTAPNGGFLTNNGTVIWAADNGYGYGGGSTIYNAGLWQVAADNTISIQSGTNNNFINAGTLQKTGGTGTSTIAWNFSSTGTINTSVGLFALNWNGPSTLHGNLTLSGTIGVPLTISSGATLNWAGGDLSGGSLTVAFGGTLTVSNTVSFGFNAGNYSAVPNSGFLTNNGTVIWAANNGYGYGGGSTIYNAGLWEDLGDDTISFQSGTNNFINAGTLQKTGGTGQSSITWNFSNNGGTLNTPAGYFNFGNWIGNGVINGNATFSGTINGIIASNTVINWSGGDLSGRSVTVAQGGTLTISNTVTFGFNAGNYSTTPNGGFLTNNGTVIWSANNGYGYGSSTIYNAGLWQDAGDDNLSSQFGTNSFINAGTLQKIGGGNTSTIGWDYYNSNGTLNTPNGLFNFGNWLGNGAVHGNATFSGTASGIIASNAMLNWSGGDWSGRAVTVAQGGTLSVSNTATFGFNAGNYSTVSNGGFLTNNGTVIWAANNIYGYGASTLYNAGLWQLTTDGNLSSQFGTNVFINAGTLQKIGGTSTTTIGWNFLNNGGILGSQTNILSLAGSYDLTGGTLNIGINSLTDFGKIQLSGSPAALTGTLSANLNNGYVPATGSSFSVLTYSSEIGTFTNFNLPFPVAWQTNYGGAVFTLTVLNVRPTLNAIFSQNLDEQTTFNVNATATDPDIGQSLTFALVAGPGGLNVSSAGAISWTPSEAQGPSSNTVVVQVTDNGTPALSATNSFVVTVNEINVPPQLTVPSDQIINEQTTLNVSASATDSDIPANPLTFGLVSPPSGLTINTNTGAISWTPTEAQGPGVYPVKVVVTDLNTNAINQQSFNVTNSFTVTVNEVNVAPVLTLPSNQTINEQTTMNVNATATDSDIPANPLTFALVSGPSGLNVAANGNVTWTPGETQGPGVYTVFIKVSDFNSAAVNSTSLSVTNNFQITVNEVNVAPVLGALNNFTVNAGQTVSFTATATDSDIPANTLTFSLVSPPAGATISGGGLFSWRVPVSFANSTNAVQVRVTDNGSPNLSDTKSFNAIVNPLAPVFLAPVNYTNSQFKIQVSGTTGPDYIIIGSSNLLQWSDLFTNLSPATPFQFTDTNNSSFTKRFYRARLAP